MLNGKGQQGQLLAALNADIVASKVTGQTREHPLDSGDLRALIKIDDRLDMSKIGKRLRVALLRTGSDTGFTIEID